MQTGVTVWGNSPPPKLVCPSPSAENRLHEPLAGVNWCYVSVVEQVHAGGNCFWKACAKCFQMAAPKPWDLVTDWVPSIVPHSHD